MQISTVNVKHIGTATVLMEIGPLRILTDPVFDTAGKQYYFGWGTNSVKTKSPAVNPESLGDIDLVLLSHDQHDDNLDAEGRKILKRVDKVITTVSGAKRLKENSLGLKKWQSTEVTTPEGFTLKITATPARHGPPLSRPFVGEVCGFLLEWEGQRNGAFYISGDTVWFRGVKEVGQKFKVGTALLHLGGVRFPIYGPIRFTFSALEAVKTMKAINAKTVIPIHYEGWKHFHESRKQNEEKFAASGLSDRVVWLPLGEWKTIEV